jgi:ectoine hydroxylase-related dioxygenase (phytanoyl-CoA dioxygenase family)
LGIFPGYQNRLLSSVGEIRTMTEEEAKQIDLNIQVVAALKPGDIFLFHSFTPHGSGTNNSSRSRRQLYLTYAAAKHGDLYEAYRKHYQDRVRG